MERYTLKTTSIDFKNGKINEDEFGLICKYIRSRDAYFKHSKNMGDYFMGKYITEIEAAMSQSDLNEIKEKLRWMPESVDKTLIFRAILFKEDEIKSV